MLELLDRVSDAINVFDENIQRFAQKPQLCMIDYSAELYYFNYLDFTYQLRSIMLFLVIVFWDKSLLIQEYETFQGSVIHFYIIIVIRASHKIEIVDLKLTQSSVPTHFVTNFVFCNNYKITCKWFFFE